MSTKSSIFYHSQGENYLHFFEDYAEPEVFFLNKVETSEVNYKFTLEELCFIARSIDLSKLERLSQVTDAEIVSHVEKEVHDRMQRQDNFSSMFGYLVYGRSTDPQDEQINKGIEHYKRKRDKLKKLWTNVSSKKINMIDFGLPF